MRGEKLIRFGGVILIFILGGFLISSLWGDGQSSSTSASPTPRDYNAEIKAPALRAENERLLKILAERDAQQRSSTPPPAAGAGQPSPSVRPLPSAPPTQTVTPTITTFGDGTRLVGPDISPGTYKANPPSEGCYWERLRGFSGEGDDLIANEFRDRAGPVIVTIKAGDKGFKSNDCGVWTKIK